MGCVAIGVGVAGATPETDINFKTFIWKISDRCSSGQNYNPPALTSQSLNCQFMADLFHPLNLFSSQPRCPLQLLKRKSQRCTTLARRHKQVTPIMTCVACLESPAPFKPRFPSW